MPPGLVADQGDRKPLPRQQAAEQPHGGARVAQIQGTRRGPQPFPAHAPDDHPPRLRPLDAHPHGAEGRQGGEAVLPLQEAADAGLAIRQGAEHDGAMGDGLVPGHPQAPAQGATGGDQETGRGAGVHARCPEERVLKSAGPMERIGVKVTARSFIFRRVASPVMVVGVKVTARSVNLMRGATPDDGCREGARPIHGSGWRRTSPGPSSGRSVPLTGHPAKNNPAGVQTAPDLAGRVWIATDQAGRHRNLLSSARRAPNTPQTRPPTRRAQPRSFPRRERSSRQG